MTSKWLLWVVAVLIGTALAFPPMISAAEKKAAQPCAPAVEKGAEKATEAKEQKEKAKKKKTKGEAKKKAEGKKKAEKEEMEKEKKK